MQKDNDIRPSEIFFRRPVGQKQSLVQLHEIGKFKHQALPGT